MVRGVSGVVGEYVRQVRESGRNPRLYLQGLFLIGLGQSIFSLLFNLYLRALGVSDSSIGQILSKVSLGAAIAAIPAAFLFREMPARLILVGAGALAALLYVMQVSWTAPETLLLIAFLTGMAATVYRLSIAPVIMREVAPRRGRSSSARPSRSSSCRPSSGSPSEDGSRISSTCSRMSTAWRSAGRSTSPPA